jgi:hypothetical protein
MLERSPKYQNILKKLPTSVPPSLDIPSESDTTETGLKKEGSTTDSSQCLKREIPRPKRREEN